MQGITLADWAQMFRGIGLGLLPYVFLMVGGGILAGNARLCLGGVVMLLGVGLAEWYKVRCERYAARE